MANRTGAGKSPECGQRKPYEHSDLCTQHEAGRRSQQWNVNTESRGAGPPLAEDSRFTFLGFLEGNLCSCANTSAFLSLSRHSGQGQRKRLQLSCKRCDWWPEKGLLCLRFWGRITVSTLWGVTKQADVLADRWRGQMWLFTHSGVSAEK